MGCERFADESLPVAAKVSVYDVVETVRIGSVLERIEYIDELDSMTGGDFGETLVEGVRIEAGQWRRCGEKRSLCEIWHFDKHKRNIGLVQLLRFFAKEGVERLKMALPGGR